MNCIPIKNYQKRQTKNKKPKNIIHISTKLKTTKMSINCEWVNKMGKKGITDNTQQNEETQDNMLTKSHHTPKVEYCLNFQKRQSHSDRK